MARKGEVLSAETRAKMSAAKKGKTLTESHKANMSAANKGKKHTMTARIKMSNSHTKRKSNNPLGRPPSGRRILTAKEKRRATNLYNQQLLDDKESAYAFNILFDRFRHITTGKYT